MSKLLRSYPEKVFFGKNVFSENINLYCPSWDCGWYWGFGYLGNSNTHYHLNGLGSDTGEAINRNIYDQLLSHFDDEAGIVAYMKTNDTLWVFCEIVETIYALKNAAEILERGGSHYTVNPCCDLIRDSSEAERINNIVIPKLIDEMYIAMGVVEPLA